MAILVPKTKKAKIITIFAFIFAFLSIYHLISESPGDLIPNSNAQTTPPPPTSNPDGTISIKRDFSWSLCESTNGPCSPQIYAENHDLFLVA